MTGGGAYKCSTPIGITGSETSTRRTDFARRTVLNADWHHGVGDTRALFDVAVKSSMCSTPIGITGSETPPTRECRGSFALSCSTPIGITGSETCASCPDRPRYHVLNADWHHGVGDCLGDLGSLSQRMWCSTPIGITGSETSMTPEMLNALDQVLNADWHHGVGDTSNLLARLRETCSVLNADWHHGVGDAMQAIETKFLAPTDVLNADWHHGVGDFPQPGTSHVMIIECSTPIGITGSETHWRGSGHWQGSVVLNADWHHGVGDIRSSANEIGQILTCSTPIGITGSETPSLKMPPSRSTHCAQRRLASRGRRRAWRSSGTCSIRHRVLNADWHHGVGDSRSPASRSRHSSFRCSTPIGITGSETAAEISASIKAKSCSTPIGITGSETVVGMSAAPLTSMCSTPIGITGSETLKPAISSLSE